MGWKFRKSIKVGPARINISQSGVGGSLGVKGYRKGIDSKGRHYTNKSIPGTGIYSKEYNKSNRNQAIHNQSNGSLNFGGKVLVFFILAAFLFIWYAGESFLFAAVLIGITIYFSRVFSDSRLYDSIDSQDNDLNEHIERLSPRQENEVRSPFDVFELNEQCSIDDLENAFRKQISAFESDNLKNMQPELKQLVLVRVNEIIAAYEECRSILKKDKVS